MAGGWGQCQVCNHPERAAIDSLLVSRTVPSIEVARRYGLHPRAVQRHVKKHLPQTLATAREAIERRRVALLQHGGRRKGRARGVEEETPADAPPLEEADERALEALQAVLLAEEERAVNLHAEWVRAQGDLERVAEACRRVLAAPGGRFHAPDTEERALAAMILVKVSAARHRGLTVATRVPGIGEDGDVPADLSELTIEQLEALTGRRIGGGR